MSENYKYAECKHCGKSVMEGEIHFCKQMICEENEFLRKNLNQTAEEYDAALGKIARLQVDLHQTVVDCERYKKALHQIWDQPLEPAHIYEIADRIQLIAKTAILAE